MQLMIYIHYRLLFFKNGNFKHTTSSKKRSFNSFLLFYIFDLIVFFFIISFQTLMHKKHHIYNLCHIPYTSSFCYLMYSITSEIYIGGRYLEDCFYCYFQQIISAVANEYLILYHLIKRAPETHSLYCNTECPPKSNQKVVKYSSVLRTKDFVPRKYKQQKYVYNSL